VVVRFVDIVGIVDHQFGVSFHKLERGQFVSSQSHVGKLQYQKK
jgi:hypothetical protein